MAAVLKVLEFVVEPGETCPICNREFTDGDACFRTKHRQTGRPVTLHALCAFVEVNKGDGGFNGLLGRRPIGEA